MNKEDNNNFILALVISMTVLIGWNYFFDATPIKVDDATVKVSSESSVAAGAHESPSSLSVAKTHSSVSTSNADMFTTEADLSTSHSRDALIQKSPRIQVKTETLMGSVRLVGARIDDITLRQYRANVTNPEEKVRLLNPQFSKSGYYADCGWLSVDKAHAVPNEHTQWISSGNTLSVGHPVVLRWSNDTGITFTRTLTIDDKYLFTITDHVENTAKKPAKLKQYTLLRRHGMPDVSNYMAVHEGLIGYINGKLQEVKYTDINDKGRLEYTTQSGWFGFTDKYWLTAIITDPHTDQPVNFRHNQENSDVQYQVDTLSKVQEVLPGNTLTTTSHVFVGPKELALLDGYEEKLKIAHFDLAVDFGWFYFITKPIFHLLGFLQEFLGSFAAAILALTVLLKLVFFPLANKSYRSMGKMKALQPKIELLKTKYTDDSAGLNQAMMELYRKEKVNPMGGCLPMVIQIPFFFAMYKVLFISIEMRHSPFWGWVQDLSSPDPTNVFTLFGLVPWDPPSFLIIGAWPLIMGVTMVLQQRMNPAPTDPVQEKLFMIMPVMFTYMLAQFPVGLVIYWAWNNLLTMAQQWYIMNQSSSEAGSSKTAKVAGKGTVPVKVIPRATGKAKPAPKKKK